MATRRHSRRRTSAFALRLPAQCLKASLTFSAARLASPAAFSARPLVLSRGFPVMRPVLFLTAPLAVWALRLIFLKILTVPSPSRRDCACHD